MTKWRGKAAVGLQGVVGLGAALLLVVGCSGESSDESKGTGPLDRIGNTDKDDRFPRVEVVTSNGLSIDESQIGLTLDNGGAQITLPLTATRAPLGAIQVRVAITPLDNETGPSASKVVTLTKGENQVVVSMANWTPPTQAEQAGYLVRYTVVGDEAVRLDGRVSLYRLLPKFGLDLWTPERLYAGQETLVRATVRQLGTNVLVPGAKVTLAGKTGVTDDTGSMSATVVADGGATLTIDAQAEVAGQPLSLQNVVPVVPKGAPRVYVSTDKPVYRPGDTLHIRAMTLAASDLKPVAKAPVTISVADGKGTKVFQESTESDAYGVASLSAKLATQVNVGTYVVTVRSGDLTTTRSVEVSEAKLPKFALTLNLDEAEFAPNTPITGTVMARYFFGTPVAGATVTLRYGFAGISTWTGTTGDDGLTAFTLDGAVADLPITVEVKDTAGFVVSASKTATVGVGGLVLTVASEGYSLPDVAPWRIYVGTRTMRGAPVAAQCTADGAAFETASNGVAMVEVASRIPTITCTAPQGTQTQTAPLPVSTQGLLVRLQKAIYRPGETLEVDVVGAGFDGLVTVDCIHHARIVETRQVQLVDGRASLVFPVGAGDEGTLSVVASAVLADEQVLTSERHAYVQRPPAVVTVSTPEASYLPGTEATLDLRVTNTDGVGQAAALGIAIADEAVFALGGTASPSDVASFFLGADAPEAARDHILTPEVSAPEQVRVASELLQSGVGQALTWTSINASAVAWQAQTQTNAAWSQYMREVEAGLRELIDRRALSAVNIERELEALQLSDFWGQQIRVSSTVNDYGYGVSVSVSFVSPGIDERFGGAYDFDNLGYNFGLWIEDPRRPTAAFADAASAGGDGADGTDGWGASDATDSVDGWSSEGGDGTDAIDEPGAPPKAKPRTEFPETLYVNPSVITDGDGKATLTIPLADAITAWRVQAIANTKSGLVGGTNGAITVFQPFFLDVDLPRNLTQGDKLTLPVGVFNFTDAPMEVTVTVATAPWFALSSPAVSAVTVGAGTSVSVPVSVEVLTPGVHSFEVSAVAEGASDALVRTTRVTPNGRRVDGSVSGRLEGSAALAVDFPANAISAGNDVAIRLMGSSGSELLSGLDGLLQTPNGCFEPMMNTTWVNALVLDYLTLIGEAKPDLEQAARGNLSSGVQQTVTFECTGGGFTWFGNPDPPHVILTAFALQMFEDMKPYTTLDDAMVTRARELLTSLQRTDGSFQTFEGTKNELLPWDDLRTTCVVAWGLAANGGAPGEVEAALGFIKENLDLEADSYTLAMCLNALMTAEPTSTYGDSVLGALVARATVSEDGTASWTTDFPGLTQSYGDVAAVETTAFVAQALFRLASPHPLADKALAFLARYKSPEGNFLTSQGTIQSLRAFVKAAQWQSAATNATVTVALGDTIVATQTINGTNRDVVHIISLTEAAQAGDVAPVVTMTGEGTITYQLTSTHYVPWNMEPRQRGPMLDVNMAWAPTTVAVGGSVEGTVTVTSNGQALGAADMPMVQIPVPAGFDIDTSALDLLMAQGAGIARYEVKDDHVLVYLHAVLAGTTEVLNVSLGYRPRFAMTVTTPAAKTWPFYKPEMTSLSETATLVVTP